MQTTFSKQNHFFYKAALAGIVLLLILFKWESLHLPYFWDEAWSYIPAIDAMIQSVPCLIPGCIDAELYRGHPLLFYFLSSGWAFLFGDSFFALHSFALVVSILTIGSFFRFVNNFVPPKLALLATFLLANQAVFLVQSTFLLPEMLITLLTLECLQGYFNKRKVHYVIAGILLCLTKETGLIIIGAFCCYHFFCFLKKQQKNVKSLFWVGLPFLPIGLFYLYQWSVFGWFFFPLHTGMIDFSSAVIIKKSETIFFFLFFKQGRWLLWAILLFFVTRDSILQKYKYWMYGCISFSIMGIIGYAIGEKFAGLFFFLPTFIYSVLKMQFTKNEKNVLFCCLLIFSCYVAFSAANFLMLRYLLCLLPIVLLYFILVLSKFINRKSWLYFTILILTTGLLWSNYANSKKWWIDDVSLNAPKMIKVHQEAVNFMEKQEWYGKNIHTHFLMWNNLTQLPLGYLKNEKVFENVQHKSDMEDAEIILFSKIELNFNKYEKIKGSTEYQLYQRFEIDGVWSEIYVKNEE